MAPAGLISSARPGATAGVVLLYPNRLRDGQRSSSGRSLTAFVKEPSPTPEHTDPDDSRWINSRDRLSWLIRASICIQNPGASRWMPWTFERRDVSSSLTSIAERRDRDHLLAQHTGSDPGSSRT
jgi:hypothetical protein